MATFECVMHHHFSREACEAFGIVTLFTLHIDIIINNILSCYTLPRRGCNAYALRSKARIRPEIVVLYREVETEMDTFEMYTICSPEG